MSGPKDGILPSIFSRVHPRFRTPVMATVLFAGLSIVLLGAYLVSTSLSNVITYVLSAIGVLFSLFYAATGLTCAWHSRAHFGRARDLLLAGIFPAAAAVFLIVVAVDSLVSNSLTEAFAVLGTIVAGVPVLLLVRARGRTGYFRRSGAAGSDASPH